MTKETIFIYGLATARKAYAKSLGYSIFNLSQAIDLAEEKPGNLEQAEKEAKKNHVPIFIDEYNNEIRSILNREEDKLNVKEDSIWCSEESFSKFSKEWFNYVDEGKKHWPLWGNYFRGTQMNQKNELKTIYQDVLKNKAYHDHSLHVNRGCKIGLDIAMEKQDMELYYCLDEIDIELVLDEKNLDDIKGRKSTTSSELRYIYRNWEKLRGKVTFISQGKKVKAPWEQEPEVWQTYQPKSWNNLGTL
ncbi:hypothetical protein VBH21_09250 [Enterococcus hirae]|nr:hypothetical protein [Enterococcus hirae]OQO41519.1 hypothetical protein BH758_05650 [Enterococcus hirae]OQO49434.1 hypothetical protein BH735_07500 [Enterococcus hirae]OQO59901.1 hypothetical protein BH740_08655 [Enterococcus hirae]